MYKVCCLQVSRNNSVTEDKKITVRKIQIIKVFHIKPVYSYIHYSNCKENAEYNTNTLNLENDFLVLYNLT